MYRKLKKENRPNTLLMALLTKRIINAEFYHDVKNSQLTVLRLEFDDKSAVDITNSRCGMGFGWSK